MRNLKISRRNIIRASMAIGASLGITKAAAAGSAEKKVTPPQTAGPFYPIVEQDDKDVDLTQFGDNEGTALGEHLMVEGQVFGDDGKPIADAVVDIWQANAAGRYTHETDPNTAPLDPNFQSWAIMKTDAEGRYRFKTVKPGAYPAEPGWDRPAHIHFKVSRRGYHEITTQMYFKGDPLLKVDRLILAVAEDLRDSLIANREDENAAYKFDITLAKA